jgi:hypothetical protein
LSHQVGIMRKVDTDFWNLSSFAHGGEHERQLVSMLPFWLHHRLSESTVASIPLRDPYEDVYRPLMMTALLSNSLSGPHSIIATGEHVCMLPGPTFAHEGESATYPS